MTLMARTKNNNKKCAAAEAEDVCGGRSRGRQRLERGRVQWWMQRSDCCAEAEEKQLHDKAMEDGGRQWAGRRRAGCSLFFLFLAGLNPTFNPTFYNPTINRG